MTPYYYTTYMSRCLPLNCHGLIICLAIGLKIQICRVCSYYFESLLFIRLVEFKNESYIKIVNLFQSNAYIEYSPG